MKRETVVPFPKIFEQNNENFSRYIRIKADKNLREIFNMCISLEIAAEYEMEWADK